MSITQHMLKDPSCLADGLRRFAQAAEPGWRAWVTDAWRKAPLGLRVDVEQRHVDLDRELERLQRRLEGRGASLHTLAVLDLGHPGLRLRHRVLDGEEYVYAEDLASGALAGFTVFNRLPELDRRAGRWLRAPHSRYRPAYQRRGIATAVYRWWLDGGRCLISGARQSAGAHALWDAMAREHCRFYVELRGRRLRHLGAEVGRATREDLGTRMVLLGQGWSLERLGESAGILFDGD